MTFDGEALPCQLGGQDAEDLIDARCDGDRDRQDVVDDQRASGDDAEARSEQLGRDEVTAASSGEELDHLAVGERDDQDGARGHQGESDGEVGVGAERLEGLFGSVRRRGQSVGAQTDPGEKGDERDVWKIRGSIGSRAFPTRRIFKVLGKLLTVL